MSPLPAIPASGAAGGLAPRAAAGVVGAERFAAALRAPASEPRSLTAEAPSLVRAGGREATRPGGVERLQRLEPTVSSEATTARGSGRSDVRGAASFERAQRLIQPPRSAAAPSPSSAPSATRPTAPPGAQGALERIVAAQRRMDELIDRARRGVDFTPAQLLALQGDLYRASQTVDLAGKVVEKATSGLKQILQTSV